MTRSRPRIAAWIRSCGVVPPPWGGGDGAPVGLHRWLIRPLLAAGLAVQLGLAGANPWGIPIPSDDGRDQATTDLRAPGPDWIQGSNAPEPVGRARAPNDLDAVSDSRATDTGRAPASSDAFGAPAWRSDWRPADGQAPGPGPDAADYRFRAATDGADVSPDGAARTGVKSLPYASAPAPDAPVYRFRGDPPGLSGNGVGSGGGTGVEAGAYRFRPLTEREAGRQGQGAAARPADPDQRSRPPRPAGPGWPPGPPPDYGTGPWPPR